MTLEVQGNAMAVIRVRGVCVRVIVDGCVAWLSEQPLLPSLPLPCSIEIGAREFGQEKKFGALRIRYKNNILTVKTVFAKVGVVVVVVPVVVGAARGASVLNLDVGLPSHRSLVTFRTASPTSGASASTSR